VTLATECAVISTEPATPDHSTVRLAQNCPGRLGIGLQRQTPISSKKQQQKDAALRLVGGAEGPKLGGKNLDSR